MLGSTQKKTGQFEIRRAHKDKRYQHLIGQFKKPGIGMLVVIKDFLEERGITIDKNNCYFIGDSWHDEDAAKDFNIPFVSAHTVHNMAKESK